MAMNLNELTLRLKVLRKDKKDIAELLKPIVEEEETICRDVFRLMQEIGIDRSDMNGLKLLRTSKTVAIPDPEHWQDIFDWITTNNHWHLLRKQLNSTCVIELAQTGEEIPFVTINDVEELKVSDLR